MEASHSLLRQSCSIRCNLPFQAMQGDTARLVKEMKERSRWDAHAKLVLPATHSSQEIPTIEDEVPELSNKVAVLLTQKAGKMVIIDASTGQILDERLVKKARQLEMVYLGSKNVYTKRPIEEALKNTGKQPIGVRWVDVNKGDDEAPNYRSRLVAKDFRRKGEDTIFAPTPPLEALIIAELFFII